MTDFHVGAMLIRLTGVLADLGRVAEGLTELERPEQVARNAHEACQIRSRIQRLENRDT